MLPLWPWVSKLSEESWLKLFPKDLSSPPRNHRLSPLIKTTNPLWLFQCMKEKDPWSRTTTCWVNSISPESHPLKEEFLKSKSLSKWMQTVFFKLEHKTRLPIKLKKLSSLMTKEDLLRKKLNKCWRMLNSSLNKTKFWKKKSMLKTHWKITFIPWNKLLKILKN